MNILNNNSQIQKKRPELLVPETIHQVLKIVFIGDADVGKTCLLRRFQMNSYIENRSTIGVEFAKKTLRFPQQNLCIQLHLWDTAGQERYKSITKQHYRGASGIVLIYDMTNPSSLNSIETWLEEIRENTANDSVLALIGNKKDLLDFEGSNLKARKFAETHKLHYYETSALWDRSSADGIETIMLDFVYEMIKDMPEIENGSQNEEEEDMETVEEDFDEKGGVEEFKNFKAKMKGKEEIWKRFSLERMKKEKEVVSLSIDRKGGCLKKNDECSC